MGKKPIQTIEFKKSFFNYRDTSGSGYSLCLRTLLDIFSLPEWFKLRDPPQHRILLSAFANPGPMRVKVSEATYQEAWPKGWQETRCYILIDGKQIDFESGLSRLVDKLLVGRKAIYVELDYWQLDD